MKEVYYINGNDTLPPPLSPEVEEKMIESIGERFARDALIEHNLIEGEKGAYGLYVKKVNGITAEVTDYVLTATSGEEESPL